MKEFNLKEPIKYIVLRTIYLVLTLFFIGWLIAVDYTVPDMNTYLIFGVLIACVICLYKAVKYDKISVLSKQYYTFLADKYYIEHFVEDNEAICESMTQFLENYEEWVEENKKALSKFELKTNV